MFIRSPAWILVLTVLVGIALFAFVDPIPQDPAYHDLADDRAGLGVPNVLNVFSNLPFLLVGVYGSWLLARNPAIARSRALFWAWQTLFSGLILTSLGSAYYHWAPTNGSLVWDRLPMILGFAGFMTILIGECVSLRAAQILLLPLLLAGVASVVYWAYTESIGAGDLRPYAMIAVFPLLLTPLILVLYPGSSDMVPAIWIMLLLYAAAKLFEHFDSQVLSMLGFISGHSLKHLFIAASTVPLIMALRRRREQRWTPVSTIPWNPA